MRRGTLLVALALLLWGCGDGGTTTTTFADGATTTSRADPATTAPPITTTTTSTVSEETSVAAELGFPEIELLTPTSGGGTRPILEWQPVDGADHYLVSVRTPSDEPYWAWRTTATSVPMGGLPRLHEGAAGPSVVSGMDWSVLAIASDGAVIAAGNHRPISP